ncbi:hypothetical protein IT575_10550 [bacterium]|nr:hypothetical protein [bacterium]
MTPRNITDAIVKPFSIEDLAEAFYAREEMLLQARCFASMDLPPRPGEDEDDPDHVPADDEDWDGDAGAPDERPVPDSTDPDHEENRPPRSPEDDANVEPIR